MLVQPGAHQGFYRAWESYYVDDCGESIVGVGNQVGKSYCKWDLIYNRIFQLPKKDFPRKTFSYYGQVVLVVCLIYYKFCKIQLKATKPRQGILHMVVQTMKNVTIIQIKNSLFHFDIIYGASNMERPIGGVLITLHWDKLISKR